MKKEYMEASNLHVRMSIKAFEKKSPSSIFYEQKAEIKKADRNFLYAFDGNEMLINQRVLVMINHKSKQIIFRPNSLKASTEFIDSFKFNLDSLFRAYGESSFLGAENGLDHFKIVHKKGAILSQTEMFFVQSSGQLQTITYSYLNGQQVVIDFELFDKQPAFEDDCFSENKYIVIANGKPSTAPLYAQYQIIDVEQHETRN